MKDKLVKRHRPRVDWYALRLELGDPDVDIHYFKLCSRKLSDNRKAYYALKSVYGNKRLNAYRLTGVWSL